jgi:hypothetical protein
MTGAATASQATLNHTTSQHLNLRGFAPTNRDATERLAAHVHGSPTIQTTMTFSRVQLGSNNLPVDADISDMIHDSNRPADPTAIRVTDSNLYRNGEVVQKHTSIQMVDRGNTVQMSDGSRVSPETAATLERQSHLRIVHDAKPVSTIKEEVAIEETPEHAKDPYSASLPAEGAHADVLGLVQKALPPLAQARAIEELVTTGSVSADFVRQAAAAMNAEENVVQELYTNVVTAVDTGYRAMCTRVGINPAAASEFISKNFGDTAKSVLARHMVTGEANVWGPLLRAAKQAGVR